MMADESRPAYCCRMTVLRGGKAMITIEAT